MKHIKDVVRELAPIYNENCYSFADTFPRIILDCLRIGLSTAMIEAICLSVGIRREDFKINFEVKNIQHLPLELVKKLLVKEFETDEIFKAVSEGEFIRVTSFSGQSYSGIRMQVEILICKKEENKKFIKQVRQRVRAKLSDEQVLKAALALNMLTP